MGFLEYSFGTGDGSVHTWSSAADLDLGGHGHPDAVALDFDGDGAADDAMWDSDGDGIADTSVLDAGHAGSDRFFSDPSHNGVWDREIADGNGTGDNTGDNAGGELSWTDHSGSERVAHAEHSGMVPVDYAGDGNVDDAVLDSDADHEADAVLIGSHDPEPGFVGMVIKQPELSLLDVDRDGVLDRAVGPGEGGYLG